MYFLERTDDCQEQINKLTRKNNCLDEALEKKIQQILENPHHKALGNVLAGKRRVHILGCFVLIYEIDEAKQVVLLRKFGHHKDVYK